MRGKIFSFSFSPKVYLKTNIQMTQEQLEYEAGYAAQAEAEYQAEMEYYAYLDKLIEDRQYQLHAVEVALDMLNSREFANSGMSPKDWLDSVRKRLAVKSLNDSARSF